MKRKAVSFIFALLMFTVFLYGCGGGGGSSNPAASSISGNAVVSGVLKDSSNNPVANASVRLSLASNSIINSLVGNMRTSLRFSANGLPTEFTTTTDNNGRYTFSNVPYGDYTLKATKDDTGAILSKVSVRAVTTDLTPAIVRPFGTVKGKVKIKDTSTYIAGAIVSLDETDYAVTNLNGEYTLNYVPILDEHTLTATIADYSKESVKVKIPSDTLVLNPDDIDLSYTPTIENACTIVANYEDNSSVGIFTIEEVDSDGEPEINGEYLVLPLINGSGTIKITKKGLYRIEAIYNLTSLAVSNIIEVLDTDISGNKTINVSLNNQYATVTGNIIIPEIYRSILSLYPNEKFIIRLIGSSTTNTTYSSQITDYTRISEGEVNYSFNSVPKGTYSILVDPVGNGLLGVGTVTVPDAGNIEASSIEVTLVRPEFTALVDNDNFLINERLTFIDPNKVISGGYIANVIGYCNIKDDDTTSREYLLSGDKEHGYHLFSEGEEKSPFVHLSANGTCTVTLVNSWEKDGFKGTISGSAECEYKWATNYVGNVRVETAFTNPVTVANESVTFDSYSNIEYNNGVVSGGWYRDASDYYYKNVNDTSFTKVSLDSSSDQQKSLLTVSGKGCVFKYRDSSSKEIANYYDGTDSRELTLSISASLAINDASIINQNNIVISYNYTNPDPDITLPETCLDIVTLDGVKRISTFTCDISKDEIIISRMKTAQDSQGNSFVAIRHHYKDEEGQTDKYNIVIYNLNEIINNNNRTPIICTYIEEDYTKKLIDFKILNNGTFYIETEGTSGYAYLFASDGGNPIDYCSKQNRTSCVMDKYGFMYRYGTFTGDDNKTYSGIIKTASLDGEPIETYVYPTTPSNAGDSSTTHGILALEENLDGSATLWTY